MLETEPLGSVPTLTQNSFVLFGELWPVFLSYTEMFWKRDPSDVLFLFALIGEKEEHALGIVTS